MSLILEERIRIGISACVNGSQVRWNKKGWDKLEFIGRERDSFIWTPVCPEVASGMGVPRPTISLKGGTGDDFWNGKARMIQRGGRDVSEEIKEGMYSSLDTLKRAKVEAFVFMEGSPSCGVYRTTLKNKRLGKPPGVFGSLLLKEGFFLIPAQDLESPIKWWDWRRRLHAFAWLKRAEFGKKGDVVDAWHMLKFLCQEVDEVEARNIGRRIAQDMPKRLTKQFVEQWRLEVLQLLRKPSDLDRINAFLKKHMAYYRKHLGVADLDKSEQLSIHMSKHKYVEEILHLEQEAVNRGMVFEPAPVLYRSKR